MKRRDGEEFEKKDVENKETRRIRVRGGREIGNEKSIVAGFPSMQF